MVKVFASGASLTTNGQKPFRIPAMQNARELTLHALDEARSGFHAC
ncbi:MAG: hypothetical protein RLZZ117_149 [Cyanobacteriota bacterium]|jgi:hypothetical protein